MEIPYLLKLTNQTYGYSISPELYAMRQRFCRDVVKGKCSDNDCPIYRRYYFTGVSCNGALARYPDECMSLMSDRR